MNPVSFSRTLFAAGTVAAGVLALAASVAAAPPTYTINKVLIPDYAADVPFDVAAPSGYAMKAEPTAIYKPHEVTVDTGRNVWISSNERGEGGNDGVFNADGTRVGQFRAGITIFRYGSLDVLAKMIIDEPQYAPSAPAGDPWWVGPVFNSYTSSTGFLYDAMEVQPAKPPRGGPKTTTAEEEGGECPARPTGAPDFVQTIFLPVVLPPSSALDPDSHAFPDDPLGRKDYDGHTLKVAGTDAEGRPIYVGHDASSRPAAMSPMGAECHARHPHGIDIDKIRGLVYLLIEHSGLKWNATRTDFLPAETTDEESGSILVLDIANVSKPRIVTGFLLGHGAHEVAVDETTGWLWQGNHEDSPGVMPPNWTGVIDPAAPAAGSNRPMGPYGFIDTGFFQALQDVEVDEQARTVYSVSHVGQRMYAFNADVFPTKNAQVITEDDPLTAKVEAYPTQQWGRNAIRYWVDLRAPFDAYYGSTATQIFATIDQGAPRNCLTGVLHYHNLAVDAVNKVVYNGIHAIHHMEHTGLPSEKECSEALEGGDEEAELEPVPHYNGRTLVAVDVRNITVDPSTLQAKSAATFVIDLSNGYDYLTYPNVEDVLGDPVDLAGAVAAVDRLERSFVHAHWLTADPRHDALVITGEHTGNVGVVDITRGKLVQVIPVSLFNPGLAKSRSLDCEVGDDGVPDDLEPHAHGVQIDPQTGTLWVSDEGEHCFYESLTQIRP